MEEAGKSQANDPTQMPAVGIPPMGFSPVGLAMNMAQMPKMSFPTPAPAPTGGGGKNSNATARFKKAPDAPKRFKSAFIIFSAEKHREIKEQHVKEGRTEKVRTTDIAKLVSEAWRELPADEKEGWEKKARKDKARYEVEKAMYKGPWKIPANKRTPKDPTAPKRPMSAFLAFSNKRRAALKRQNPNATNADLSKMLSKTWKEAPEELRHKYMEEEAGLRATYKQEMAKWRKKVADEKKAERKEREAMAMQAAEARQKRQAAGQPEIPLNMMMNGGDGGEGNDAMMQGMYNPYAMAAAGGHGGQGGDGQGAGGFNPALLGNPFAAQLGLPNAAMQFQLSQLLAGQQFLQNPALAAQRGALGLYGQGIPQQGMQGGQNMAPGMAPNPSLAGFGTNMPDLMAQQRAMMEQAQGGHGGQGHGGEQGEQISRAPATDDDIKQEDAAYGLNSYNGEGAGNADV